MRLLPFLFVAISSGIGLATAKNAATHSPPFVRSSSPLAKTIQKKLRFAASGSLPQLSVRGGAVGPLDPVVAAKITTVSGLVQGFLSTHAPTSAISHKLYDMGETPTAAMILMVRALGTAILSMGVVGLCLFFLETDVNTAIGWYSSLWAMAHLVSLFNNEDKEAGGNPSFRYFWLPFACWTSYACFSNADYASTLIKAAGALTVISCLPMAVVPLTGASMYGYKKEEVSPATLALIRSAGFWLVACGTLVLTLAMGVPKVEPVKAFGYACATGALQILSFLYVTNEVEKLGMPRAPMVFWLLFHAINSAAMIM